MTRGEVADRSDVSREAVRYYEQRGLIPEPPRTGGDYRIYDESYVERIRFIKRAQELGFSLREIDVLLELRLDRDRGCGDVRTKATAKLENVREKIRDLQQIEMVLERLAISCSGEGPTSVCPILKAMERGVAFEDAPS
jgi:MerR family mercuric resistance operon transcriptional regulator